MALFSVIQQNTGTEMVRFLHLGDENLHLGNKTLHSAIKCDMIDLLEHTNYAKKHTNYANRVDFLRKFG